MAGKKGAKKTFRIVPVDDTRNVQFDIHYSQDGEDKSRTANTRADLFLTVRAMELLNVEPSSIVRTVTQAVRIERPGK